jgi:hypothetical protein
MSSFDNWYPYKSFNFPYVSTAYFNSVIQKIDQETMGDTYEKVILLPRISSDIWINATPHTIRILKNDCILEIPSNAEAMEKCRASTLYRPTFDIDGVCIEETPTYSTMISDDDDIFNSKIIVSTIFAQALCNKYPNITVYVPNSGPNAIRDESGKVWCVRTLFCYGPRNHKLD